MAISSGTSVVRTWLLIPGIPGSARTWELLRRHVPPDTQIHCWPLEDWHVGDESADAELAKLEKALCATITAMRAPVVLVGHSFGGWLAARALSRVGGQVERAVLVGAMARLPPEHAAALRDIGATLASGQLDRAQFAEDVRALTLPGVQEDADGASRLCAMADRMGQMRTAALLTLAGQLATPAHAVRPFQTPADVIHSAGDQAMPLAYGEELARLGSRARLRVFGGDSHFPHWAHAAELAQIVFDNTGCSASLPAGGMIDGI
ncbi:MAG: alpha/beta hydrolase [Gammaproteobacteria bacterium]